MHFKYVPAIDGRIIEIFCRQCTIVLCVISIHVKEKKNHTFGDCNNLLKLHYLQLSTSPVFKRFFP